MPTSTSRPSLALEQAKRAASELKAKRWKGPLHGIPYAAKDLFDTKGVPTAWGTRFLRDRVPDTNATVVDRLEAAGAILLGKTAMVEFAGCLGYRFANASASGPGRNPWDPSRWTGGSSSGSGAAVPRVSPRSRWGRRPGARSCVRPRSADSPAFGPRTGWSRARAAWWVRTRSTRWDRSHARSRIAAPCSPRSRAPIRVTRPRTPAR
jgi:hypothetical protein